MKILLALAFILGCVFLGSATTQAASCLSNSTYDSQIKASVGRWWPDYPVWTYFKAQLCQESRLDPSAVSPVGARGLAQFMPATWNEVTAELGYGNVSPHLAKYAIQAGAYYMAKQRRFPDWRGWPDPERHRMALGAYNAGAGNVRKALKACAGAITWAAVAACFPGVTGRHAAETTGYVTRIDGLKLDMERLY